MLLIDHDDDDIVVATLFNYSLLLLMILWHNLLFCLCKDITIVKSR